MPAKISGWHYHLLDVNRVLGYKTMAVVVQGVTKLPRAGFPFKLIGIQSESEISTSHRQRWSIGFARKGDFTLLTMVGRINPVVHPKPKVGDLSLLVVFEKPGEQNFLFICHSISIGISHVPNVGRSGNQ